MTSSTPTEVSVADHGTSRVPPLLRLMRPQQWVKNAFVAAPLFFTPSALHAPEITRTALAVLVFCALASAVYIVNDYVDRQADRLHPTKRTRPLAAGTVSPASAFVLFGALVALGMAASAALSGAFLTIAAAYLGLNGLYSFWLKNFSIIDVMIVAICYVLRVFAGADVIGVEASVWIIVCTMLVSLFIALAKRRDDLVRNLAQSHRAALSGYSKPFLDTSIAVVLAGLLVSYLIYTTEHASPLYLTTPFVIMGVLRYLQIALVEERSGSPTTIVLTDRFLILCVIAWAACFGVLIHIA